MPLITDFPLPTSPKHLELPEGTDAKAFIVFVTSDDPVTGQSWCPDVRAAWPVLEATFSGPNTPALRVVEVGQKPEWKDLQNIYRTNWKIPCIPALVRYERVNGETVETGKLVEGEILDKEKLGNLIGATL
ncbi:hypothetical protein ANOM_007932 [Aspergillus nomiae NRRL 13137]|uniref:Thioredoxin domain-containing protein n=1 Tax=Aspergillus nomiae NRRL (strain ATCC 15546 / NRRL 13137 / CBS 260.88 / M93) TaxID=1509407 RepID=A0A0L1IVE6_ASPN3|nr:uncharacterized protein ANOM_007932 [Aspergillus nomiae NRRL 13137]KNG83163.1 hypothetical protein ANOM_007932 [Aspergillus nomiae NRRL 13137]